MLVLLLISFCLKEAPTSKDTYRARQKPAHDMAILAAPTSKPNLAMGQRQKSEVIAFFEARQLTVRCQQVLSSVSLFLLLESYSLASIAAANLLVASSILAARSLVTLKFLAVKTAILLGQSSHAIWESRTIRQCRKKLFFEFMVLVLGPSGNGLLVLIFWPGWLVLSAAVWATWAWIG